MTIDLDQLTNECNFSTSRSSGPGGQHVNKTETRVELRFNVIDSKNLSFRQKKRIYEVLGSKLVDNNSTILITAQNTRSQGKNKLIAIQKFHDLILESIKEDEIRIPTKPTYSSIQKRKTRKRAQSQKKSFRGNLKNRDWS